MLRLVRVRISMRQHSTREQEDCRQRPVDDDAMSNEKSVLILVGITCRKERPTECPVWPDLSDR